MCKLQSQSISEPGLYADICSLAASTILLGTEPAFPARHGWSDFDGQTQWTLRAPTAAPTTMVIVCYVFKVRVGKIKV